MRLCFVVWVTGVALQVQAQSELDVERFSTTTTVGTARSLGVGGAMSAVGGDFSATYLNPAGLGLYRKGEWFVTPTFRSIANDATYIGVTQSDTRSNFGITSAGIVFTKPVYRLISKGGRGSDEDDDDQQSYNQSGFSKLGIESFSIALGFNQIDNYHRNTRFQAFNPHNSFSDALASRAFGLTVEQLGIYEFLAFNSFVIDNPDTLNPTVYNPVVFDGQVVQDLVQEESGRTNQYSVAIAGNFGNRLYVGVGVNLRDIRHETTLSYVEADVDDVYQNFIDTLGNLGFNAFEYRDVISTSGFGINANLGIIVQPTDFLRLAASVQSPTVAAMQVEIAPEFLAENDDGFAYITPEFYTPTFFSSVAFGNFEYTLTTPYRITLGAMVQLGKFGFISFDAERTDYSTARLSDNADFPADFGPTNDNISQLFAATWNFRGGIELRYEHFYLRGGVGYFGAVQTDEGRQYQDLSTYSFTPNPVNPSDPGTFTAQTELLDMERLVLSGGIGFRNKKFFLDLALTAQESNDKYLNYVLPDDFGTVGRGFSPVVVNTRTVTSVSATFGVFFRAKQ